MKYPVVIIGGGINALGVARSLGPYALCTLVFSGINSPASHSRYVKPHPVASTSLPSLVDDLLTLAQSFKQQPLLIITEEKAVYQIAKAQKILAEHFLINLPSIELVSHLQNKADFYQIARKHKAPVPDTMTISNEDDIHKAHKMQFPCVFKPLEQNAEYGKNFKKAYKVQSIDEVKQLYKRIKPILNDMILQQWIEGDDSDLYFSIIYYDQYSNPVSSFTGRKLRSWPVNVGGTASCINAPETAHILEPICHKFFKAIQYKGLVGMEFKKDKISGEFIMVEPTVGRTDFQHEIATLSGINILKSILYHFLKRPIPQSKNSPSPIVWQEFISDYLSMKESGKTGFPKHAKIYQAIKRWNDPMPYIHQLFTRLKNKLGLKG
ncbi:hypothetical protein [Spartinivicinus poritis]|uniref:ATP-grasp domain-containing protein n=1 Tax=Spartinivicinus poritis TaxID=2994640 RepID=A0ABT5UD73_9GAMM|nr:hypothetical protein [Spartinivicinus sp. A2-2]MDE1463951.1 hypothetical protein [Spartinivicinus sp. A2-2]